jgi:hypothetical protein
MGQWKPSRQTSRRYNGKFRQSRFAYNPLWYKKPHRVTNEPNPCTRDRKPTDSKGNPVNVVDAVIKCKCNGCLHYLRVIAELNPARFLALTDDSTRMFLRRISEREKQFANDRFERERRGKTLSRHLT